MGPLYKEAVQRSTLWAAKGGKTNKRRQRKRMLAFAGYIEQCERVDCWRHVGKRQVIRYYKKQLIGISDAVRYQHFCAIRILFDLVDNPNEVPRPFPVVNISAKFE